jgi:phospholipid/cholesterol/gamma-HCH transport system substrate-binding protein
MTEQGMRFRIGLFVLAALVLLATLVTMFGSVPSLFKAQHEYIVTFSDAPGVGAGTPVRRSGVRIGEVKGLDLDNDTGEVHVHLLIDRQYTLHRNEQPTLVQGLLGSDATIDMVPATAGEGGADVAAVPPGERLKGFHLANVHTLLTKASEVVPTTQHALTDMRKSLQQFEKLAPLLEETMREYRDLARATREAVPELRRTNDEVRGLAAAARETVPNIGHTSDEVRDLAKAVRETVPALRETNQRIQCSVETWGRVGDRVDGLLDANQDKVTKAVDNLNETLTRVNNIFNEDNQRNLTALLANVRASSESLQGLTHDTNDLLKESRQTMRRIGDTVARADDAMGNLQQATKPLADRSNNIMKNLDESTQKLNVTVTELQALLQIIAQSDGTLRRVIVDPSLYNHLDEAACMLARLMPRLERMLHDLEVFSDKIARHPEELGIGGVVRPSNGLK